MPNYKIENTLPIISDYIQDPLYPIINRNKLKYSTDPSNEVRPRQGRGNYTGRHAKFTMVDIGIEKSEITTDVDLRGSYRFYAKIGPNKVLAISDWYYGALSQVIFILDIENNKILRKSICPYDVVGLYASPWQKVGTKVITIGAEVTGGYTTTPFIYDYETDTWSRGSQIPGVTAYASSYPRVYNDEIYLFSYYDVGINVDRTVWKYNLDTDSWTNLGTGPNSLVPILDIPQASYGVRDLHGQFYQMSLAHNTDLVQYNFETNQFTTLSQFPNVISTRHCLVIGNGRYIISGGYSGATGFADTYTLDLYNGGIFTQKMDCPIVGLPAIDFVYAHRYYAVGFSGSRAHCAVYDIASDSWQRFDGIPITVDANSVMFPQNWLWVIIDNKLYIFDPSSRLDIAPWTYTIHPTTLCLNLDTLQWSEHDSLNMDIYLYGGRGICDYDTFDKYGRLTNPEFDNKLLISGFSTNGSMAWPTIIKWEDHAVADYQTIIHNQM